MRRVLLFTESIDTSIDAENYLVFHYPPGRNLPQLSARRHSLRSGHRLAVRAVALTSLRRSIRCQKPRFLPAGIEPTLQAPEACVLSIERREVYRVPGIGHRFCFANPRPRLGATRLRPSIPTQSALRFVARLAALRAAGNRTRSTSTPWMRTTGILRPVMRNEHSGRKLLMLTAR